MLHDKVAKVLLDSLSGEVVDDKAIDKAIKFLKDNDIKVDLVDTEEMQSVANRINEMIVTDEDIGEFIA